MKINLLLAVAALASVLFWAGVVGAVAAAGSGSPDAALMKPDIVVNDMKIIQTGSTASGQNVRISVNLFNAVQKRLSNRL